MICNSILEIAKYRQTANMAVFSKLSSVVKPEHVILCAVGFSCSKFLWTSYLNYRQRQVYFKHESLPEEAKDLLDSETFDKSRAYAIDKSSFGFVQRLYNQILSTSLIYFLGYKVAWKLSGECFSKKVPLLKSQKNERSH